MKTYYVGKAPNELEISANVRQTSKVTTGVVVFDAVQVREGRTSPPIPHGLGDSKNYAIVLGREINEPAAGKQVVSIGDLSQLDQANPLLVATYEPGPTFRILLRDTRNQENKDPVSYFIRWWAVPSTDDLGTVRPTDGPGGPPPPGDLSSEKRGAIDIVRVQVSSGGAQTLEELAKALRMEPADLQPLLDQLRSEGSITLANGKFSQP